VKSIVTQALKEYAKGHVETKRAVMNLLRELLLVRQTGGLSDYLAAVIPRVVAALKSEDVALKGDALLLLRLIVELHDKSMLKPFVVSISQCVSSVAKESYLKIKAEALRTCGSLAQALSSDDKKTVTEVYRAVYSQLILKDVDQEVKEAAILSMAVILALFGDVLPKAVNDCSSILLERLTNELTRLPALRAIGRIAHSPLKLDISLIATSSIKDLCSFL